MPKVFIIILNWNGRDDTLSCLNSVKKIDYPDYHVTVVDNGSTDDSVRAIQACYPSASWLTIIRNDKNLGYTGGNNVGIRHALEKVADYILLLNNDVIVDPLLLETLVQVGEADKRIGILGPKIYCYPETAKLWQWGLGGNIHWKKGITRDRGYRAIRKGNWDVRLEVDYVAGCALLVKREVIEKIGVLDDRYYLYYEELDFCIRAGRAGFKTVFVPDSVIWHKVGASAGGYDAPTQIYYKTRNRLLFMRTHSEKKDWRRFLLYFWGEGMCKRGLMLVLTGRGTRRNLRALWSGWRDFRRERFYRGPDWLHPL